MQSTNPTVATEWAHLTIEFSDRDRAQRVAATRLGPALDACQTEGSLRNWWFVRKHPTWRVRYQPLDPGSATITRLLEHLTTTGAIRSWASGVYEPETAAFGGEAGMDVAHHLFHADSHHLLTRFRTAPAAPGDPVLGPRETAVVLCSVLMRSAGLDWYEQGDVWAKVSDLRPTDPRPAGPDSDQLSRWGADMTRLMTVDAHALCTPDQDAKPGPLQGHQEWVTAFEQAGQTLADLARHGRLQRGLRAVLAHHVIFHANRAGLSLTDQSTLAALACDVVFTTPGEPDFARPPLVAATNLDQVTTLSENRPLPSADQLRAELTVRLCEQGVVRTLDVEAAIRAVPRDLFVPGFPVEEAYADNPVYIKANAAGVSISAASQPRIVAMMLEQLAAAPGDRICEAGAGTGYNAALMATIVGPDGHVVTIDVDADLVDGARRHLAAAGVDNVEVILADGAIGHPDAAPFDRFIATVGAWEVPDAWLDQLTPTGRLVVPLRLRGAQSRSIVFERGPRGWHSLGSELAVFMPLRGLGDDAPHVVTLTPERDVTLQVHQDQDVDPGALAGVLDTPAQQQWSGVFFSPMVSFEWMDLWLACRLANGLMRMSVQNTAAERGPIQRMFGWGSMATTRGRDLAYLTIRPADPDPKGGKLYEVGVIGHGPTSGDLIAHVAHEIRVWDEQFRDRSVRFELPDTPDTPDPDAGRFVLARTHHPVTVVWE